MISESYDKCCKRLSSAEYDSQVDTDEDGGRSRMPPERFIDLSNCNMQGGMKNAVVEKVSAKRVTNFENDYAINSCESTDDEDFHPNSKDKTCGHPSAPK